MPFPIFWSLSLLSAEMASNTFPYPSFNWKSSDQLQVFDMFQAKAELWLAGGKVGKELQYTKIVSMLGDEGLSRWFKFKL